MLTANSFYFWRPIMLLGMLFTAKEAYYLVIGLLLVGPFAANLGFLIWWLLVKPSQREEMLNELGQSRCQECGGTQSQRIPICSRCGAWLHHPTRSV